MLVWIDMDGGGGFMKVCLSIFNLIEPEEKCRTLAKTFKNSGVRKVFILTVVPDIQENYWNVKKIWMETGIHKLKTPFTIATDLKLCNILLGLMSHSAIHPYSWCDVDKQHLHLEEEVRYTF